MKEYKLVLNKKICYFLVAFFVAINVVILMAQPVFAVASAPTVTNTSIFGNGTALVIEAEGNGTTVYIDSNRNGILEAGEQSLADAGVANAPIDGVDLSEYSVYGGGSTKNITSNTQIVMFSGNVKDIYGGGYGYGSITGNVSIRIEGGTVENVQGGSHQSSITGTSHEIYISGGTIGVIHPGNHWDEMLGNIDITISGNTILNSGIVEEYFEVDVDPENKTVTISGDVAIGKDLGIRIVDEENWKQGLNNFALSDLGNDAIINLLIPDYITDNHIIATGAKPGDEEKFNLKSNSYPYNDLTTKVVVYRDGNIVLRDKLTSPTATIATPSQTSFTYGDFNTISFELSGIDNSQYDSISYQWKIKENTSGSEFVNATGVGATEATYKIDDDTSLDAGTYILKCEITVTGKDQQVTADSSTKTITINKADTIVNTKPTVSQITYGTILEDIELTGGTATSTTGNVAGKFSWENDTLMPVPGALNNTFNITFTPDDLDNYNTSTSTVTISDIAPKQITPIATADDKEFNGDTDATGSISFDASELVGDDLPTASTANFVFTSSKADTGITVNVSSIALDPSWTTKYELSQTTGTDTANIDKKEVVVVWSGADATYTYNNEGQKEEITAHFIDVNDTQKQLNLSFSNNDNVNEDNTFKVAGEHTVTASIKSEDSNYKLSDSESDYTKSLTMNKATVTIGTIPVISSIKYGTSLSNDMISKTDGEDGQATVELTPGNITEIGGTFTWANAVAKPTVTNDGYEILFTPTDADNYKTATKTVDVTVTKKELTTAVKTVEDMIFDGGTLTSGEIALTGAVFSENPTASAIFNFADANVGTSKVANVTEIALEDDWDDNYFLSESSKSISNHSSTADITVKEVNINWPDTTEFVYDGTDQSTNYIPTYTDVESEEIDLEVSWNNTFKNVGNYEVTVSLTDTNYALNSPTEKSDIKITQRPFNLDDFEITEIEESYVYTENEIKPTPVIKYENTVLELDKDYTVNYENNIDFGAIAKITIEFKGNFSGNKEIEFSIGSAPLPVGTTNVTVFKDYDNLSTIWSNKETFTFETTDDWVVSETADGVYTSSISFDQDGEDVEKTVYLKKGDEVTIYNTKIVYKLDTVKPTITDVEDNPIEWLKGDAEITFDASDALSDIKSVTVFRQKQGEEPKDVEYKVTENNKFTADKNGIYIVTVTDNAGNETTEIIEVTKIDNAAPVVTLSPEFDSDMWYGESEITVSADDMNDLGDTEAGIESIVVEVYVNGEKYSEEDITSEKKFTIIEIDDVVNNNVYTYKITATDNVGNISTEEITVQIDTRIDEFTEKTENLDENSTFEELAEILDYYENLSSIAKSRIGKNTFATENLEKLNTLLSNKAAEIITTFETEISSANSLSEIETLRQKYEALPAEQKEALSADIVADIESKIADAQKVKYTIEQIESASVINDGDSGTYETIATYEMKKASVTNFEKLTETQKSLLDSQTVAIFETIKEDVSAIESVTEMIDEVETLADIADILSMYEDLSDNQKEAFPTDKLDDIANLETIENKITNVFENIDRLKDSYDEENEEDVIEAKALYESLSEYEKELLDDDIIQKIDRLYQELLTQKAFEVVQFEINVAKASIEPEIEMINNLEDTFNSFDQEQKDSLTQKTVNDYEDLLDIRAEIDFVIKLLNEITKDNIIINDKGQDALDAFDDLNNDEKAVTSKATGNKAEDIKSAIDAIELIKQIPSNVDDSYLSDKNNQIVIDEAKKAVEMLSVGSRALIPDDILSKLDNAYIKFINYLEYNTIAPTETTTVEVLSVTNIKLPDDSNSVGKTVVELVVVDSETENAPPAPEQKQMMISIDAKLIAKLFIDANASEDDNPDAEEQVQPNQGQSVLIKLLLPDGYNKDTLEIWHVKDNGVTSRINNLSFIEENEMTYVVYEVDSFSHFIFYASRIQTSSSRVTYVPVIQATENGTVEITPEKPYINSKVTIIPTPDEGYEVDAVTVTDRNNEAIEVTEKEGLYKFEQPYGAVTINVSFKPIITELPFIDVSMTDWYYDSVEKVYNNGLMSGTSNNKFEPNTNTTRAMVAQILYAFAEKPEVEYSSSFLDLTSGAWYEEAVEWAEHSKIYKGISETEFSPDTNITREQLLTVIWRYYGEQEAAINSEFDKFTDAEDISEFAKEAFEWGYSEEIIKGKTDDTLNPKDFATRAEIATIFARLLED